MSATLPQEHVAPKPKVLIVGAGLGGLLLGALLERINVPYQIFERASELRSLGSAMSLGATILPVFEQLGLLDELFEMSLPCPAADIYHADLSKLGTIDMKSWRSSVGYNNNLFARPQLYALLLKQVPIQKITLGKKVIRSDERDDKVFIHCADDSSYEGEILVGSDGAYSGVRQSLFKRMDAQQILPKGDLENLSVGYVSMVGVTGSMDPEKIIQLKDEFCHFSQVLGEDTRSWGLCSLANHQVGWLLSYQVAEGEARSQRSKNAEWGPESNEAMYNEFKDMLSPWGGKMGDFMDHTPKHLVSKVFLEEKLFETWYHGRTVLIGDACHKMLPGAGQGAVNAMQDAVVLANSLWAMHDQSSESITAAFKEYYTQRYQRSITQFKGSAVWSKTLAGQTWAERLFRNIILNYLPEFIQQKAFMSGFEYRPQIAWLPLAKNRGSIVVLPQEGKRKAGLDNAVEI